MYVCIWLYICAIILYFVHLHNFIYIHLSLYTHLHILYFLVCLHTPRKTHKDITCTNWTYYSSRAEPIQQFDINTHSHTLLQFYSIPNFCHLPHLHAHTFQRSLQLYSFAMWHSGHNFISVSCFIILIFVSRFLRYSLVFYAFLSIKLINA